MHLIFEETQSSLFGSNDGRLQYDYREGPIGTHIVRHDGIEVFATKDRVKVDVYIAGYDLGRESSDH